MTPAYWLRVICCKLLCGKGCFVRKTLFLEALDSVDKADDVDNGDDERDKVALQESEEPRESVNEYRAVHTGAGDQSSLGDDAVFYAECGDGGSKGGCDPQICGSESDVEDEHSENVSVGDHVYAQTESEVVKRCKGQDLVPRQEECKQQGDWHTHHNDYPDSVFAEQHWVVQTDVNFLIGFEDFLHA